MANFFVYKVCFFMVTKILVNLTHLRLSQISQTYLKIFLFLEHMMKILIECYERIILMLFSLFYQKRYISLFKYKCAKQRMPFTHALS